MRGYDTMQGHLMMDYRLGRMVQMCEGKRSFHTSHNACSEITLLIRSTLGARWIQLLSVLRIRWYMQAMKRHCKTTL